MQEETFRVSKEIMYLLTTRPHSVSRRKPSSTDGMLCIFKSFQGANTGIPALITLSCIAIVITLNVLTMKIFAVKVKLILRSKC